jgi:hypothetical protein
MSMPETKLSKFPERLWLELEKIPRAQVRPAGELLV